VHDFSSPNIGLLATTTRDSVIMGSKMSEWIFGYKVTDSKEEKRRKLNRLFKFSSSFCIPLLVSQLLPLILSLLRTRDRLGNFDSVRGWLILSIAMLCASIIPLIPNVLVRDRVTARKLIVFVAMVTSLVVFLGGYLIHNYYQSVGDGSVGFVMAIIVTALALLLLIWYSVGSVRLSMYGRETGSHDS
jgi:hypothetical protein